jgi:hypothetical protein
VFRILFLLIASILLISVLRGVIGFIARFFANSTVGPQRRAASAPEALKKDPVCGTFVAPSTAVRKDKEGQTYFFCSPDCRDKF